MNIGEILRKIFRSRFLLFMFIAALFSVAIWFAGPFLSLGGWAPFETITQRLIWIGSLFGFALLLYLLLFWLRRRREKRMAREMLAEEEEEVEDADEEVKAELKEMRKRMKDALKVLRKSKLGGRSVYQLPWYLIIGPPGAGKTTAIVNSGLSFPLADKMGKGALGGVGGTRNCDWWFTNQAVLIDTAGRYTTQDSDEEADSKAWTGFLTMLRKNRKRQPINGAIVAISLSDLSMQDENQRKMQADSIRHRLSELREKLGVRFPVYVLFTKADLIAGFSEYFENLGREDREQVWGFTFPLKHAKQKTKPLEMFDEQFQALLGQINNLSLERLQQETDSQRRGLISGFAQQVASLQGVARDFLTQVFEENKFEKQQLFRGVYFTSGTQEGTPIDRLMMGMARTFGIGRQAIGTGMGQGRSYFLKRVLDGVIFKEAGLVSADDKVARRYKWFVRSSIAAAVLVAAGIGTLWTLSFIGNRDMIAKASERVELYDELAKPIPVSPIDDTNLNVIVTPLNILRTLPGNPAQGNVEPPRELTYGLYQGEVIGNQAKLTYRNALNERMLPRLLLRLERQMQANLNNSTFLFEALKVYMMLGLQGPLEEDLVTGWMAADWETTYPGESNAQMRQDLMDHLVSMINQPMREISLHGSLVAQVQTLLAETPVSQRIYNAIIQSPQARDLPDWRVLSEGGPRTAEVLIRPSGEPLSSGVEGIYTKFGFYNVFLPAALSVAEQLKNENWVLGERGENLDDENALTRIAREVLDLYYSDYNSAYEKVLGDIDIKPMGSMAQVVSTLDILSSGSSPIKNIILSVQNQTRLTQQDGPLNLDTALDDTSQYAQREFIEAQNLRVQALVQILQTSSISAGLPPPPPPGTPVEERFDWLNRFTTGETEGAPSPLDKVMQNLTALYQEMNRLSVSGRPVQLGDGAAVDLQTMLQRLPDPMKRWVAQVTAGSSDVQVGGARSSLDAKWKGEVLPTCNRAVNNRYPFFKNQPADISIQDFARLFAPQGLIDQFFTANLAEFVDTTTTPWRWRRVQNQELGISDSVLAQFQRAAEIRDTFFLSPGLPVFSFDMKPIALDSNARRVELTIEGQTLEYRQNGAQLDTPMQWPGGGGPTQIVFKPDRRNTENGRAFEGPWALFRMFDAAVLDRTPVADRFRVTFTVGGRIAIFQLRPGPNLNPFQLPALSNFRCPGSL